MLQFRFTVHRNIFVRDLLITIAIYDEDNAHFGFFSSVWIFKKQNGIDLLSLIQAVVWLKETKTITATVIVKSYDA